MKPTKRSQKPREEDSLTERMMGLGAHWWPSWIFYARHKTRINGLTLYDFHYPPRVNVGYPSSGEGVWVWGFKFSEDQQIWEEEDDRKPYWLLMPDGWKARINMVFTMDGRCELLKEIGARFYETKDDCEDLSPSLEGGIQRERQYKALLDKMDNHYYVEKWLSGGCRQYREREIIERLLAIFLIRLTNQSLKQTFKKCCSTLQSRLIDAD